MLIALRDVLVVARSGHGSWTAAERLEGKRPKCLAVDPLNPARVYCGTADHGLWLSDDAGRTWGPAGSGVREPRITAVAVAAAEARGGHGVVYLGTEPSAVYRSEDRGAHWDALEGLNTLRSAPTWSFPPRPETHHVRWLEPDPHRPGRIFVCIEAGALVRSQDYGRTWLDRVPGGPLDTHTLATHAAAPGRLYAAAGDGYFESDDAGASWRRPMAGLRHGYLFSVAVDPADPDTVLVSAAPGPRAAYVPSAAESAVYRKTAGDQWREVRAGLPDNQGTTVSVLLATAAEFWAANNRGVYRSTDCGRGWQRIPVPWPNVYTRRDVVALALL
ncbi:MAG: hypothetical protein HY561_12215 [Gemmatimonadetes bacterium]|nr:hypothetical protein [Gemmatimonadota bacterium]